MTSVGHLLQGPHKGAAGALLLSRHRLGTAPPPGDMAFWLPLSSPRAKVGWRPLPMLATAPPLKGQSPRVMGEAMGKCCCREGGPAS